MIFRPMIPSTNCPYQVKILIKQAWDENPDRRPTFTEIVDGFGKVQKGKK